MLCEPLSGAIPARAVFSDVPEGAWYAEAVNCRREYGIANDTLLNPFADFVGDCDSLMSVEIPAMVKVGDAASFGIRMTRRDIASPLSSLGIVEMSPQGDREGE